MHDQSFINDPTRILRAVRFEQRLHFQIERRTLKIMKSALNKKAESTVKLPRYFTEFKKILCEPDPVKSIRRLKAIGGLRFLDPRLKIQIRELFHLHQRIKQVNRKPLYKDFQEWWLLYFLRLIAKANDRIMKKILNEFHFKKDERASIVQSRNIKTILNNLEVNKLRGSDVYRILKPLQGHVIYYLRVITTKLIIGRRIDRFLKEYRNVKLKINGEDLKKLGAVPGREIGKILETVLCLKIDKRILTKKQELDKATVSLEKC